MRSSRIFSLLLFLGAINSNAQSVELSGKISAAVEVDGIHIINKTAGRFTVSNADGTFVIPAKLNDTILFSGISYHSKEIKISKFILTSKQLPVYLEELVNALDEVVVGKILTGDLSSDLANSGVKRDINFYDLGIPGYTGKPLTQTERRLKEAADLDFTMGGSMGGGGVGMSLNPIINGISGRTKKLKAHAKLERLDKCLDKVISNLSDILFNEAPLDESYRNEFFYFCSDDMQFEALCRMNDDLKTFEFLKEKLVRFKSNLQIETQE
ncbi:MAG: hypothetical protein ABI263_03960 [Gelidibacter sp.]